MARWADLAPRQESTKNQRSPRRAQPSKFVIHIAAGFYDGTISWCKTSSGTKAVSAHFVVGKLRGEVAQLVSTADEAWTQSDANRYSISVENAGFVGDSLTAWQIETCAQLYARAHKTYPDTVPLRLMTKPEESGLGWHGMGGDAWGGHQSCPGPKIVAQLPQILARAIQLSKGSVGTMWEPSLHEVVNALANGSVDKGFVVGNEGLDQPGGSVLVAPYNLRVVVEKLDQLLAKPSGGGGGSGGGLSEAQVRAIVREELDKTRLTG